jgi:hypothetical protein
MQDRSQPIAFFIQEMEVVTQKEQDTVNLYPSPFVK